MEGRIGSCTGAPRAGLRRRDVQSSGTWRLRVGLCAGWSGGSLEALQVALAEWTDGPETSIAASQHRKIGSIASEN
jgi:hypothetical protein